MRTIKLMADYDCWPLWEASPGQVGNIDPAKLPISKDLRNRLSRWADDFNSTLIRDDPARSRFSSTDAKAAFSSVGLLLGEDLKVELGPEFCVIVRVPQ